MPYCKIFEETLYDEQWLRRVYVDEGRNAAQVALLAQCTRQAVHAALRRFKISVKGPSEAQKLSEHWPGSDAPRPRGVFSATINDASWLEARLAGEHSLSQISRDAGCSPAAVQRALERAGLIDRWRLARRKFLSDRRSSRTPPRQKDFVPRRKRSDTQGALYARARRSVPEGPCVLCGQDSIDVNHVDGDIKNMDPENLERLCRLCHRQQHTEEHRVAFQLLAERGISRKTIALQARRNLQKREKQ